MNSKEAFKAGFLLRCADAGMTGAEVAATMQKAAEIVEKRGLSVEGLASGAAGLASPVTNFAQNALLFGAIGAPIAAGYGVAHMANEALNPEVDEDDVKKQELIDELQHYARQARERRSALSLRA
jgi:DNA-binding LytR/AlgR family response regulator